MINFVGGKAEWTAWDGAEGTRLAFVGLGVHPERFVESLKRCVSE
jgi:hypothetical protein